MEFVYYGSLTFVVDLCTVHFILVCGTAIWGVNTVMLVITYSIRYLFSEIHFFLYIRCKYEQQPTKTPGIQKANQLVHCNSTKLSLSMKEIRCSIYKQPFSKRNLCTRLLKDLSPVQEIVSTTLSGRLFQTLEAVWIKLLSI